MSTIKNHKPSPLTDPGQLFAEIPGILGFYPHESVVVMCFARSDNTRYQLGPTLRVDLDNTSPLIDLPGVLSDINFPTDLTLALIVTETPGNPAATAAEKILIDSDLPSLVAIWQTTDLLSESTFTLSYGTDDLMQACNDNPLGLTQWTQGVVAPVDQAVHTRSLLSSGQIISVDRGEAAAYFDIGNDQLTENEISELEENITSRIEMVMSGDTDAEVRKVITGLREALGSYQALATGDADLPPATLEEKIMGDLSILTLAGVALSGVHSGLRDLTLGEIMDHPDAGQALAVSLSRTVNPDSPHEARANALCAYFLGALRGERDTCGPYAQLALRCARESRPQHTLSALMLHAHGERVYQHLYDSVYQGVEIARTNYHL